MPVLQPLRVCARTSVRGAGPFDVPADALMALALDTHRSTAQGAITYPQPSPPLANHHRRLAAAAAVACCVIVILCGVILSGFS